MPHVGQPGNVLSSAIISGPVTQVFGRDELLGTFLSFFLFQNKTKKNGRAGQEHGGVFPRAVG